METEQQHEEDPYQIAQHQFNQAAERLELDTGMREILRSINRELTVTLSLIHI